MENAGLNYNWGLTGHDKALASLEKDIKEGNVAHAYLFAGPDDIGKFCAARKFAQFLQCKDGGCGECPSCQEIEKGYHADTVALANDGESIKIEKIREVIEKMNMTKQSPYKILLMQNIERMTPAAGNALLKTLEDPAPNVVFILTTSRIKEILPTIVSRVRIIKFGRLADGALGQLIKKDFSDVDAGMLGSVCDFAQGRPGKAFSLVRDPQSFEDYRNMYADICGFLENPDRTHQFLYVGELAGRVKEEKNNAPIYEFLDVFQLVLRQQMLMNTKGENAIFPLEKCVKLLQNVQETRQLLKRNINTRLVLENLMLNI